MLPVEVMGKPLYSHMPSIIRGYGWVTEWKLSKPEVTCAYENLTEPIKKKGLRYLYIMFIAALFPLAKSWKQPKCPLTDECPNEM